MKKLITLIVATLLLSISFVGCEDQSDIVSHNLSKEADNFNVVRQITVVHGITGDVTFQMTGRLSIETTSIGLEVVVEYEKGMYAKHFILLGDNGMASVEQLRPARIDEYNYTLNINKKMFLPVDIKEVD